MQPEPMLDPEVLASFKDAMRRLASTITILTTYHEGRRFGMTATAVSSLSMNPPSLLACVNQTASIHDPIGGGRRYCVNLLGCDHVDLVPLFSGRLAGEERFNAGAWATHADGTPYLSDAQASIFCSLDQSMAYGTHSIFIGRVEHVLMHGAVSPLIYQEGSMFRTATLACRP